MNEQTKMAKLEYKINKYALLLSIFSILLSLFTLYKDSQKLPLEKYVGSNTPEIYFNLLGKGFIDFDQIAFPFSISNNSDKTALNIHITSNLSVNSTLIKNSSIIEIPVLKPNQTISFGHILDNDNKEGIKPALYFITQVDNTILKYEFVVSVSVIFRNSFNQCYVFNTDIKCKYNPDNNEFIMMNNKPSISPISESEYNKTYTEASRTKMQIEILYKLMLNGTEFINKTYNYSNASYKDLYNTYKITFNDNSFRFLKSKDKQNIIPYTESNHIYMEDVLKSDDFSFNKIKYIDIYSLYKANVINYYLSHNRVEFVTNGNEKHYSFSEVITTIVDENFYNDPKFH
jgi:hypothetical protein